MKSIDCAYMEIISEINHKKEDLENKLISESVYAYELFEDFFKKVVDGTSILKDCHKFNYDDIINMFPYNWKYLKYLKKDKILYVIISDSFINQCNLNLTNKEILSINSHMKDIEGIFYYDFENENNVGIIAISQDRYYANLRISLMHEMIHYLQWNTGKSIKSFLNENAFDIDNNVKNEIKNQLNIDNLPKINKEEIEAYSNTIYYELKRFFQENNIPFARSYFGELIRLFENVHRETSFKTYYENVKNKIEDFSNDIQFQEFNKIFEINSILMMLLIGFFRVGYAALKNHLFGYFDKEKK